jgi:hypothetical protein
MNNHASYFIELIFSALYSLFLSCVCFLWSASFLSKMINMGAWLPAGRLLVDAAMIMMSDDAACIR